MKPEQPVSHEAGCNDSVVTVKSIVEKDGVITANFLFVPWIPKK